MANQLALLSGASPRTCKHGPVVRLTPGPWRLNVQGLKDSTLLLYVRGRDNSALAHHGLLVVCDGTEEVQLSFGTRGNEDFITVIAEKQ
jgi:hypothetical protein